MHKTNKEIVVASTLGLVGSNINNLQFVGTRFESLLDTFSFFGYFS